jgi:3-oxoacyl-[acyl-carrier-protein] synthase II
MALAAAREAIQMACLDGGAQRTGLVVGCTTGGMVETEVLLAAMHADPALRKAWPELIVHPLTSIGDRLEETLGRFSRVRTVSSACSSGATAVVVAAGWLLHGEVDAVVVVGTEALSRLTLAGFNALAAIDSQACRPFARGRRGTTLGEGAGCLVIEGASRARARGARPIAELSGWAMGSEAHHITNPDPGGALVGGLIGRALWRAGLSASDVDYVNAHGTATPANDAMEAAALANALGGEIDRIPVSSSKGQIGHTLGAAGAIEAAITALVVARRTLVPTAGLDEPDPALRLVHVPNVGREVPAVRAALSNAFGFGGMAAVLVFQPPDRSAPATPRPASEVVVTGGASCERTGPRSAAEVVVTGGAAYGTMGLKGARECADLPSAAPWVHAPVNPDSFLEVGRARRLDRAARLATVAVQHALRDAGLAPRSAGVVLSTAFGGVDACAAFMHGVLARGPRSASPAEFPNLVPSSPIGHASIYLGMQGPSFAVSDLATGGDCAFVQAVGLIAAGDAVQMVAGSFEPRSEIVERALAPLFLQGLTQPGERGDLAVAVVAESFSSATQRGASVLARVIQTVEWRDDPRGALQAVGPPRSPSARVMFPRQDPLARTLLDGTAWGGTPSLVCAPAVAESEALGALAILVAAGCIAEQRADEVLVVGRARGRGFAVVLAAP